MAKHNECPECQQTFNHADNNADTKEQVDMVQQRTSSPPIMSSTVVNPFYTGRPRTPVHGNKHVSIDRQEIIRRIKSGGSRSTSPELERPVSRTSLKRANGQATSGGETSNKPIDGRAKSPEILQQDNAVLGREIERPRSALHRGDFHQEQSDSSAFGKLGEPAQNEPRTTLSTSPGAPWHPDFPSAALRRFQQPIPSYESYHPNHPRERATSITSFASSFTYKPPTSPLVQASRPDTPDNSSRRASRSPDKSRRHTFSPHSLQRFGSATDYPSSARQPPTLRSERTYPYQAHQPRRSLNSSASLPQTPFSRSRRPSIPESPLHHATLVGSYEESILRGRMSTTPSKPLNFVAQIGVLGKGDCKASLRCPPHATVPFPAVFYSYPPNTRSSTPNDQPSPYVGLIDLENNLPAARPSPEKRRQKAQLPRSDESRASSCNRQDLSASDAQAERRRRQKQKRRTGSPKAPPGGSYRIPQQGQLQLVIKNPNKTAVKLFLVPYDLSDMEPGQKTFIRQRSYSAGPIIDAPLYSPGGTSPSKAADHSDDRPVLRYLIHLHICCPSRGRFFLYKSVRVVFANRVPDGKERLRNEVQLPEPRYSTYKPGRHSNVGLTSATTPTQVSRRRSALESDAFFDESRPLPTPYPPFAAQSLPITEHNSDLHTPIPPLRLTTGALAGLVSHPASRPFASGLVAPPRPTSRSMWSDGLTSDQFEFGDDPHHSFVTGRRLGEPFDFDRDRNIEKKAATQNESLLSMRLKNSTQQKRDDTRNS